MKYESLRRQEMSKPSFWKKEENISKCCLLKFLPRVLSVKGQWALTIKSSATVIPCHLKIWMSPLDYPIMCLEKSSPNVNNPNRPWSNYCLGAILSESTELMSDLIVLGFNDTSTLEGHFVSSPREREKRDRRESRGDERERQGRKRNRNESEETEEIKTFHLYPYPLQE